MPKYLQYGSYTEEGTKGLLKEGGSKRREALEKAVKSAGGTLEAFYYAFGDNDFYFIVDGVDNIEAITASLVAKASGAANVKTIVLVTPEEIDQAVKRTTEWRPPGK